MKLTNLPSANFDGARPFAFGFHPWTKILVGFLALKFDAMIVLMSIGEIICAVVGLAIVNNSNMTSVSGLKIFFTSLRINVRLSAEAESILGFSERRSGGFNARPANQIDFILD